MWASCTRPPPLVSPLHAALRCTVLCCVCCAVLCCAALHEHPSGRQAGWEPPPFTHPPPPPAPPRPAPAGEDDYRVCLSNGVIAKGEGIPCPLDDSGCFTDPVTDFKGQYCKVW